MQRPRRRHQPPMQCPRRPALDHRHASHRPARSRSRRADRRSVAEGLTAIPSIPNSDLVRLLSPVGQSNAYYALYGWAPGGHLSFEDVPGPNTAWSVASGSTLAPGQPVTLRWDNGKGLIFIAHDLGRRELHVHRHPGGREHRHGRGAAAPYGIVARHGQPTTCRTSSSCTKASSAGSTASCRKSSTTT